MKERPFLYIAGLVLVLGALLYGVGKGGGGNTIAAVGSVILIVGAILVTNTSNRAIAVNTFREALRNKVLYLILFFAVLMIGFAVILGSISIGENDRVIKHVGLSAIQLFGIFLALFVGVNMVYEELERRTIYTIIAHGVPRQDFVIGKFLGLLLTIVFNFFLMALILSGVVYFIPEAAMNLSVLYAVFLSVFEMMVIIAFAILFSSFSTPIISAILTLSVYIIGHLSDDLLDYIKIQGHEAYAVMPKVMVPLLKSIFYCLPHLNEFNAKNEVMGAGTADFSLIPAGYGIIYTAFILFLACWIFSRKDIR
jgi:ABC-type transport system involved in multi-copper enzyme maturation permease subunit